MRTSALLSTLSALARLSPWLLAAVCLVVVTLFFLLAQYAHPSSDDFCLAAGIQREGVLAHLWNHYIEWSGRYSGNTLYGIYPLVFGMFDGYWLIPVLLMVALFAATVFFASTLFRVKPHDRCVLLSALVFVAVFLLGMISPASGLYWMAGALSYQSANIFLLLALGLMIRLLERQKRSEKYFDLLALLLAVMVMAVGFNETSMIALTAMSLLFFLARVRSGWAISWPWLLVLITTLLCVGVVYFSPGNAIRAADFPLRHDLPRALSGSVAVGARILWKWISSPVLLTATLLSPFAVSRLYRLSGRSFVISKPLLAAAILGTLAIPVLFQFPAWWSMGGWAPPRTVDATYFVFLVSWFLTTGAITVHLINAGRVDPDLSTRAPSAAMLVLAASVLFTIAVTGSKNYRLAQSDLANHASPWNQYMQERYAIIENAVAGNQLSLVVPDYQQPYPRTIYFNDIARNSGDWRNRCYAEYFGLQRIKRARPRNE
ncbi:MAG: DUF6056 family protein [Pseudomonadota bacterium]